jgi:hypothetical protein
VGRRLQLIGGPPGGGDLDVAGGQEAEPGTAHPFPPLPPHIGFQDPDDCDRLRDHLLAMGYTDADLHRQVGLDDAVLTEGAGAFHALARAEPGSPLETLLLLFLHGTAVPCEAARRATGPVPLDRWIAAGLLTVQGDQAHAAVRLVPFRGRWLAYDRPERKHDPAFVMGVGSSTVTLMNVAVRAPVEAMLDLGCGCGTQGLFSAEHARGVTAADRNPRAVAFLRFNARLNRAAHVEAVCGDLFQPIAGRRFGLILSNPPFVISPETHLIYRDGGMEADGFSRKVIREAPAALEDGGFCQILCNWAHYRGQPWQETLARWFEGLPVDAWAMRSATEEAPVYAETWIRQTEGGTPASRSALFRRWMAYYEHRRIEKVSLGIITLRRTSSSRPWIRLDDTPPRITGPCGDAVARAFAGRDALERLGSDAALLDLKPRAVPAMRLRQVLQPASGAWEATEMRLSLESGLAETLRIDVITAGLVSRCDGARTLRELVDELAGATGTEPSRAAAAAVAIARALLERGFLEV